MDVKQKNPFIGLWPIHEGGKEGKGEEEEEEEEEGGITS